MYLLPNSKKKSGKNKSFITLNDPEGNNEFTGTVALEKGTTELVKTTKKNSSKNGPGHLMNIGSHIQNKPSS